MIQGLARSRNRYAQSHFRETGFWSTNRVIGFPYQSRRLAAIHLCWLKITVNNVSMEYSRIAPDDYDQSTVTGQPAMNSTVYGTGRKTGRRKRHLVLLPWRRWRVKPTVEGC